MARILVVEDDPAARRLVSLHLESEMHEVIVAEDGMQGLYKTISAMPDLIIADFRMPVIDGISMLAAIRANALTASIPVIFLTVSDDPQLRERARSLGVSDFLVKPFNRAGLLEAIAEQLRLAEARGRFDAMAAPSLMPPADVETMEVPSMRVPSMPEETIEMDPEGRSDASIGDADPAGETDRSVDGSVLVFALRDMARIGDQLRVDQQAVLISSFSDNLRGVVDGNSGWTVRAADGVVIGMFEGVDAAGAGHAERALKAAMHAVLSLDRLREWSAGQTMHGRPALLAATAGVHAGRVSVCHVASGRRGERTGRTIIGDTVNVAARLSARAGELGWSIVASDAVLTLAGPRFGAGGRGQISVKGRAEPLEIVEITALRPRSGVEAAGETIYSAVGEAIRQNTLLL